STVRKNHHLYVVDGCELPSEAKRCERTAALHPGTHTELTQRTGPRRAQCSQVSLDSHSSSSSFQNLDAAKPHASRQGRWGSRKTRAWYVGWSASSSEVSTLVIARRLWEASFVRWRWLISQR